MLHNEEWKDVLNHPQFFQFHFNYLLSIVTLLFIFITFFVRRKCISKSQILGWMVVIYGNTVIQVPLIIHTKLMVPKGALLHFLKCSFYLTLSDLCPVKGLLGQGLPFSIMSLNHGYCWVSSGGSCNIFPSERPKAVLRVSWKCHLLFRAEVPVKMILLEAQTCDLPLEVS